MAKEKKKVGTSAHDDFVADAKSEFERIAEIEADNRQAFDDDLRFARHGEQWPEGIEAQRTLDGRPCLTINRMQSIIRQVVNDSRQNKPSIKCHPIDDGADVETAKVLDGLFRNIEHISDADVAYDTAVEYAASGGFGYMRVGIDYASEDAFDLDIMIERVANPLSIYGDPDSTRADSSDWEMAFVVDRFTKSQFQRKWGEKSEVSWDDEAWQKAGSSWRDGDSVQVAEYWHCEYVERTLQQFTDIQDGSVHVYDTEDFQASEDLQQLASIGRLVFNRERKAKRKKFIQTMMTGVEVLEENDWLGRYIPIIPVYGDEYMIEGKRYLRSLIHSAKDAQRMFNYWRTNATELVALAPRVPWIGPKGTFDTDTERWATANQQSHSFLEYDDKGVPPQRQPLDIGVAAGSLQEALNASDDIKAITGIYDASLGARSNETSGRAIMARQREGDVSTFHFSDNLSRAIRHLGRVVLDLVPHYYNTERIIRVLGEDGKEDTVRINGPTPVKDDDGKEVRDDTGNVVMTLHDLTLGKYDIAVSSGPSFTTRREEAAFQMTELVRAFPQAAPFVADIMARNFDWPGAEEIAERFKKMVPGQEDIPPQVKQQMIAGMQKIKEQEAEINALKQGHAIDAAKAQTQQFAAETDRMEAGAKIGMDIIDRLTPAPQYSQN